MTPALRAEHAKTGPLPPAEPERRRFTRFYLWRRAILQREGQRLAGYAKDVSKSGIRVICPVQLFPGDEVRVTLENGPTVEISVCRCRRLADDCYECGAEFIGSAS